MRKIGQVNGVENVVKMGCESAMLCGGAKILVLPKTIFFTDNHVRREGKMFFVNLKKI